MEGDDHLMDRGWGDFEISLKITFRWRSAVELRVRVDKRKILTLEFRVLAHGENEPPNGPQLTGLEPHAE